jgi:ribosomal subunit interface protein
MNKSYGGNPMDKPLEITFRNMDRSGSLAAVIGEKCAELERFYTHIIGMHVVVETPQRRHRKGKLYHVTVKVQVPGKWLVASRSPWRNSRHEILPATVNDAFHAMERQLEDYARRQRGDIKHHEIPEEIPVEIPQQEYPEQRQESLT